MKTLVRILITVIVLFLIVVSAVLYAIYSSDPAQQEVLEEKTFNEEIESMDIQVENSRVDIVPSTDNTVRVVLTGSEDEVRLQTDVSGNRLNIEVEDRFRFFIFGGNQSHSLQVYVPAEGLDLLTVESDNGTILAKDIGASEVSLEADNGRIALDALKSEKVEAETDNGAIDLTRMDAAMTVRSSNGRIVFTDVSGTLQAKANNGRIELTTEKLDYPIDFETDNGRIEIHTDTEPNNARIESRTDNGVIDVFGRNSEEVSFGSGDVLIRLVTNNGHIVVK